jgi:DNA-binding CsgD family transcriptional regulator
MEMKDFAVSALLLSNDAGVDLMVHLCRAEHGPNHEPHNGNGNRYVNGTGTIRQRPARQQRRGNLTRREQEVLELMAEGNDTNEIASTLSISTHTVRNHVQNVLFKLQVNSRLKAINLSRRLGMI